MAVTARTRFMAGGILVLGTAGHRGLIPDPFTDSVDVVLEGRLGRDGTFRATTLLAKCASRYENAPDRSRSAPGYRAAQARRA